MAAAMDVLPHVNWAHEQAADALRRADSKATTLLSLVGAALAGVVALTTRQLPVAATVALWLAATPIFVSVLVLLSALRPRLARDPVPGTWLAAAYQGPAALLDVDAVVTSEALAADVAVLGRIALGKYRHLRFAVALLATGLSLAALAMVLAVLS